MDANPVVSICCATYDHESCIRDALDGFLAQAVDFPIEILVNDDASSDRTPAILREYEARHPGTFRVFYQESNQFSRGVRPLAGILLPAARGEFIALCEGDDYWIDPLKLQMQVAFLRSHPDVACCFTDAWMLDVRGESPIRTPYVRDLAAGDVDPATIIRRGGGLFPSASLVFRRDAVDRELFDAFPTLAGDELLILGLMRRGRIHYMDRRTCVYRRWSGGIYSSVVDDPRELARRRRARLPDYLRLAAHFGPAHRAAFADRVSRESLFIIAHASPAESFTLLRHVTAADLLRLVAEKLDGIVRPRALPPP